MKKNKEIPKLGKKATVAGLVLCFVAMITLVGVFSFGQYQDIEEELAQYDASDDLQNETATPLEIEVAEADTDENEMNTEEIGEDAQEANAGDVVAEGFTEARADDDGITGDEASSVGTGVSSVISNTTTNASITEQLYFSEDGVLMWPVMGGTIMRFSMDQAVYFETLDQYKLNSAMIIDGEVGTEVLACERAMVESIEVLAETGTTITMDMGNGYTIVYGQLTDVRVTEGSIVEKGQIIGVLAESTKYYSVEGPNLYLQLLKDGEPIDPFMYLE